MKNKFTNSAGDKGRQANFKGFMCGKPLPKAPAGKKGAPEKEARPAPFRVPVFAARALNATGQSRVTLSPR